MAVIKKNTNQISWNPRIVIAVCVLILILIPCMIWFLGYNDKTSTPPESNLVTDQGSSYTFSYPKAWSESKSGVVDSSGEVLYIQPPNADATVNPHVIIKITPITQKALETTNLAYTLLKYNKADVTIDGVSGQKYTQVLQSVHGPFHSIAYVFQSNGNLYLIESGYTQQNTDPQFENEFNQIVTNFKFQ